MISRIYDIVGLIRLRSLIADGVVNISNIADSNEIGAIISTADALVAEDEERKQIAINGLLSGIGDIAGSSCRFRAFKCFVKFTHRYSRCTDIRYFPTISQSPTESNTSSRRLCRGS